MPAELRATTPEPLNFSPELREVAFGTVIARVADPKARGLVRIWADLHPTFGKTTEELLDDANKSLSADTREYVEEMFGDSRAELVKAVFGQRSGGQINEAAAASVSRVLEATTKRVVGLGEFLQKSGIKSVQLDLGSRVNPKGVQVTLEDVDAAMQIAVNTVKLGIGEDSANYAQKEDPGAETDMDAIGSWRAETLADYK